MITSRVTFGPELINLDGSDPEGTAPDSPNPTKLCLTANPSFSGQSRGSVETTCSNTTPDAWGNIIRTFESTGVIDPGTFQVPVDWPIENADAKQLVEAIERDIENRWYVFHGPPTAAHSTGPKLKFKAHCTGGTPAMGILMDGNARLTKTLSFKITGDYTIVAPVART
jgi:hypothetical protein